MLYLIPIFDQFNRICLSFSHLAGLHLDEKTREEVKKIKKEISDLGTNFGSNLNEDTTYVLFTEDELKGVPEDLVKSFEKVYSMSAID